MVAGAGNAVAEEPGGLSRMNGRGGMRRVRVISASEAEKSVLRHLLELYQHDFSEFDRRDVDRHGLYRPTVGRRRAGQARTTDRTDGAAARGHSCRREAAVDPARELGRYSSDSSENPVVKSETGHVGDLAQGEVTEKSRPRR